MNLLDRAAERLRGHFIKHRASDGFDGVCMNGAFLDAGGRREPGLSVFTTGEYAALEATVRELYGEPIKVSSWNDRDEVTEEDALHVFELASKRFEAEKPGGLR